MALDKLPPKLVQAFHTITRRPSVVDEHGPSGPEVGTLLIVDVDQEYMATLAPAPYRYMGARLPSVALLKMRDQLLSDATAIAEIAERYQREGR